MLKTTLVIGASLKPNRYSHRAVIRLNASHHPVLAIGLRHGFIGDIEIHKWDTALQSNQWENKTIDTVTLYLNPKRQEAYYNFILKMKPKRVIFNPGTENPEFYELLRKQDIAIDVSCTLVLLATERY